MPARTIVVFSALASLMLLLSGPSVTSELSAQVVVQGMSIRPATPIVKMATMPSNAAAATGPVENQAPNAVGATPEAKKESPEESLVKLLVASPYQRTTKAILDAWSQDAPKESDTEEKTNEAAEANVVNAFESLVVYEFDTNPTFKAGDSLSVTVGEKLIGQFNVLSVDGMKVATKFIPTPVQNDAVKDLPDGESDQPSEESDAEPETSAGEQTNDDAGAEKPDGIEDDTKEDVPSEVADSSAEPAVAAIFPEIKTGDKASLVLAAEKEAAPDPQQKVEAFKRSVALGKWGEVKSFLNDLEKENASKVYDHLLTSLGTAGPATPAGMPPAQAAMMAANSGAAPQSNFLTPSDILQLIECSPKPIELDVSKIKDEDARKGNDVTKLSAAVQLPPGVVINSLPPEALAAVPQVGAAPIAGAPAPTTESNIVAIAKLMSTSQKAGHDFNEFVNAIEKGTTHFGGDDKMKKLTAADLFMKSRMTDHVEKFLPNLEDSKSDLPALKIWSELALSKYRAKKIALWLEKAWEINQQIVGLEDLPETDKTKALTNLIELSPKVDKDLGEAWLSASFTDVPERGKVILTNLGTKTADLASKAASVSEKTRFDLLRLQNQAAEKLIAQSAENANKWNQTLTLLIQNWLTEAETSLQHSKENSRSSQMQIDMYGNFFWGQQNRNRGRGPKPIKLGDILEVIPSKEWQALVSPSLHMQLSRVTANLHLRVNEEDKAFPFIEDIAASRPDIAKDLVHKFLEIWTRNHDPNSDRNQRNPYIYFYGFDQKADAIPLTRSKQERNLAELSKFITRIRNMELEDVDEKLLANAFTTCHSSAEVFRDDAVKAVFGQLSDLKPETIAALAQKMRTNLAANWRDIKQQEAKQTNRREPEVQQEVLRGYEVGLNLIAEALKTSPENWQLHLAKACLMYEENAYAQTVQKSSEFSNKRDLAFGQFEVAAEKYQSVVAALEEKDHSTDVYDFWFYCGLGACDLGKVTDKTVPDLRQYAKIRTAIESLPGALAESHMAKVANNMFTRMSPLKPEIKFRYLRGGFEIVGDHPRAWEARNLHDYYKDLVSEIKLEVKVDGDDNVGHNQPFGVYVNILHSKEIERESGGFAKYAQNQNGMMYAFNYGRPTEDYRDKFNDAVNQSLEEHFEIQNVTFQNAESMQSHPTEKDGWRVTPYAYILLKPRGSEVDRIAPLKLDLDFLDTSGYVVIPIESPAVVIDASKEKGTSRPVTDLQVTQTLDERQADDGKLIVEITAKAKGLVPDLEEIIDVERENFEVVNIDDQGVLPSSFDQDTNDIQILSDRSWTVEYKANAESEQLGSFAFSESKLSDASVKFQRYESADLVEADQTVALEKNYAEFSWAFLYWLVPLVGVGLIGIAAMILFLKKPAAVAEKRFDVPENINPFTVLSLLEDIRRHNGINQEQTQDLETSINRVQKYYFAKDVTKDQEEDLASLATRWVSQAK